MGDVTGEPATLLLPLWRRDRLCGDEEQRVGALARLRLRDLRRALAGQRRTAERAASARWQVRQRSITPVFSKGVGRAHGTLYFR